MNAVASKKLADVIEALGGPDFGAKLDAYLRDTVRFDMSCIFLFRDHYPPTLIHDGYTELLSRRVLGAYVKGGYLLDPFYVACMNHHPSGVWRMESLAPDSFLSCGFMLSPDIHPCVSASDNYLSEEIGFIIPATDEYLIYSLMRTARRKKFSEPELRQLAVLEPTIGALVRKHCDGMPHAASRQPEPATRIEDPFVNAFNASLTPTQLKVVKMMLRGHSNVSIARTLGIVTGTVKVHKSNIYRKLNISTQDELFQMFVRYLTG